MDFECKPIFTSPHQSLLKRFEETLTEAAQEEDSEADYEGTNQEPERTSALNQVSREWSLDQEGDQEPLISERSQPTVERNSRAMSQRRRLQDLLMTTRKRASSCFGARMDRIGNASGLGCNNGRGKTAAEDGRKKSNSDLDKGY